MVTVSYPTGGRGLFITGRRGVIRPPRERGINNNFKKGARVALENRTYPTGCPLIIRDYCEGLAMTENIKPKWYSGKDILNRGIKNFELLAAVNNDDLIPYYEESGNKVVDLNKLPKRRMTIEEFIEEIKSKQKLISQAPPPIATIGKPIEEIVITNPQRLSTEEIITEAKRRYEDEKPETSDCPQDCVIDLFTEESIVDYIYKADEVEAFINKLTERGYSKKDDDILNSHPAGLQKQDNNVNSFIKTGEHWEINFNGKSKIVKSLDGISYIATLLEQPGESISCKELFQLVSGKTPDKVMPKSAAINEGFNIGSSKQAINDKKAKTDYKSAYLKLQNDLSKAESEMEREEIEKEMETILPNLKGKTFADPNDRKAQVNIKKRLDTAYKTICKADMKEIAKHLQDNIKTDDAYGLRYTGDIAWNIIIK